MTNEKGETFFVGKDVAKALGYDQTDKAIQRHVEEDDRMKCTVTDKLGRAQRTVIINESGLYTLVLSSKLPKAKKFKQWLPLLWNVPKFTGVRIHAGNTVEDTEGCILVGKNQHVGSLADSRIWVHRLKQEITDAHERGEKVYLTVK